MATTSDTTYDELERRVLLDFAARVLADPRSNEEHVQRATERLMSQPLTEAELDGWLRSQPAAVLAELRDVLRRHAQREAASAPTSD